MKKSSLFSNQSTLRRILRTIRPYSHLVILSLLLAGLIVVLQLLVPIYTGNAVDVIVDEGQVDFPALIAILKNIGLCILITSAAQWFMTHINNTITYRIVKDLRTGAFRHVQSLPLSYLDGHPTGDTISRIITDVEQVSDGLLLGFSQLFTGVITIAGTIVFMLRLQPILAVIVIIFTPLSFQVAKWISSRSYTYFKQQSNARAT